LLWPRPRSHGAFTGHRGPASQRRLRLALPWLNAEKVREEARLFQPRRGGLGDRQDGFEAADRLQEVLLVWQMQSLAPHEHTRQRPRTCQALMPASAFRHLNRRTPLRRGSRASLQRWRVAACAHKSSGSSGSIQSKSPSAARPKPENVADELGADPTPRRYVGEWSEPSQRLAVDLRGAATAARRTSHLHRCQRDARTCALVGATGRGLIRRNRSIARTR
jgi:hypothetical protein